MGRGFRVTTAADADLWTEMRRYYKEWGDKTKVYWVKTHAEEGGKLADCHEKENERADVDTGVAYKHPNTPEYREGCASQLDSVYGSTIDGKVVVHKMGTTLLRHLQVKHYPRYWVTRSRAGAWVGNTDIEGHAAACRRAQKANPNAVSNGSCKEMNGRRLIRDLEHQCDHRYDPSDLATGMAWSADTIDAWVSSEDGKIANILSQLLTQDGFKSISEAATKGEVIDIRHSMGDERRTGGHSSRGY